MIFENDKIPLWIRCQFNGKSAFENYKLQHDEMLKEYQKRYDTKRQQEEMKKELSEVTKDSLQDILNGLKIDKDLNITIDI